MQLSCSQEDCNEKLKNKNQLYKHVYDKHTPQYTFSVDDKSYTVDKDDDVFSCPLCEATFKTTSTFVTHIGRYNKKRESKNKRVYNESDSEVVVPINKLPRVYSENEIETAQMSSGILTKPLATLSAVGGFDYEMSNQQRSIALAEVNNLFPIALTSSSNQYYLLGNENDILELCREQPKVEFIIPPEPSNQTEVEEMDSSILKFIISKSSMHSLLSNEEYREINKENLELANTDWQIHPEARYSVAQLFSGCILLEGTRAILINCIEPYGRKKTIDPHYERYWKNDHISTLPDTKDFYNDICVRRIETDGANKLIIGLFSCNLLVTSSCTIQKDPVACVGPSTDSFTPSKNTKIFLNKKSVETTKVLFNKKGCTSVHSHDVLSQIKQVRSKFDRIETYTCCRSSSHFVLGHLYQPYTIWTLYDYDSAQTIDSQAKLGSLLFQQIALSVIEAVKNKTEAVLQKKTLLNLKHRDGHFKSTVDQMLKLFGKSEEIEIIGNKDLDTHLKTVAQQLVSPIKTANDSIKSKLLKRFT